MTGDVPACTCITCGDQGIEMVVVEFDATAGLARCADLDGSISEVDAGLIDVVALGARLMVHAGTAIALLSPDGVSA
jgi:hypothetical protein